jgi:glycosyl transferase family 25
MISAYYINLDRDTERRTFIEEQFKQHLRLVRIPAVDGTAMSKIALERFSAHRSMAGSILGPCEIACTLSHRKAWEAFLEDGDDWGLIAEDDIHISNDFAKLLDSKDWIPPDADVVKAETTFRRCRVSAKSHHALQGRLLRRLESLHGGSGAYFVNRKSAYDLIAYTDRKLDFADHILFNPKSTFFSCSAVYQIIPSPTVQDIFIEEYRSGMTKSNLVSERKTMRSKPWMQKLARESIRPALKIGRFVKENIAALFCGCHYTVVPYQKNIDDNNLMLTTKRYL